MTDSLPDTVVNLLADTRKPSQPRKKRPFFAVYENSNQYGGPGLYWHGTKGMGGNEENINYWICSPIHAEAMTAGEGGADYGLLLRFKTSFGHWQQWCVPMAMLRGSGEELRGELLNLGMRISPQSRNRLNEWLMLQYPKKRLLAATRVGWHGRGCFVMPDKVIGHGDVIFQSPYAAHNDFSAKGTLADWQNSIGARCKDNAMLQLVVSAALAGPLLERLDKPSCGIHFVGDSSIGKSTALYVAASIWGSREFVRTWRATANGLEGAASALNDTALILDEISEADSREIGAIVYALGNGTGKSRAAKTGYARPVARWRVALLSSGERSLSATMAEGGKRTKAGQSVRLLDIPCQRVHGLFDVLHDMGDGRAMADAIREASNSHYGHIGPAFIDKLIADKRGFSAELASNIKLLEFKDNLEGRAASQFAVFATAGELAIDYGLLPWNTGDALEAAGLAYKLWREFRGQGHTEDKQILQAVDDFIARYGDSCFSAIHDKDTIVKDRAGYWLSAVDGRVYLFTTTGLKLATKGFDFRRVTKALDDNGWIVEKGSDGKVSKQTKIRGKNERIYYIKTPDTEEI